MAGAPTRISGASHRGLVAHMLDMTPWSSMILRAGGGGGRDSLGLAAKQGMSHGKAGEGRSKLIRSLFPPCCWQQARRL